MSWALALLVIVTSAESGLTPEGPSDAPDARLESPWYAQGGVGMTGYGSGAFGFGMRVAVGRVWWSRGLGLELQGQAVLPMGGMYWTADGIFEPGDLTAAGTGSLFGDVSVRFRFGKTWGPNWIHGLLPLGIDLLGVRATRAGESAEEESREVSAWVSSGLGLGFRRRFRQRMFFGLDATATVGYRINEDYELYGVGPLGSLVRVGGDGALYFGANF